MADTAAVAAPAASPAPASSGGAERTIYQASTGRKVAFSFILLILLPFFASLVPMLAMRMRSGLWHDLPGFVLFGVAFAVLMLLVLSELMRSLRMRITLGQTKLHLTVPKAAGPTPLFGYAKHDIPWGDITSVETRREIYGGWIAPALMKGARVIIKDGRQIKLGYVNEANSDPAFPFPEIAAQIGLRAGVPVTDRGSVRRSATSKFLGWRAVSAGTEPEPIGQAEIDALNAAHRRFMLGLVGALLVLVGVSMALELTASQAVARDARAAATPAKSTAPAKK